MADDRPVDDPVTQLGKLSREVEEFRRLVLVRLGQQPTGSIEISLLPAAKPGTLLLQGQTLNRVDYPGLWQWAQDNGRVTSGLFGSGNGTTTFTLPNFKSRYLIAADTGDIANIGALVGANSRTLSVANMPAHDHGPAGASWTISIGVGGPTEIPDSWAGPNDGGHRHRLEGGGQAFDNRPASIAVNFLIWT